MPDPQIGKGGTFYVPFPVIALDSDATQYMLIAGGGGSMAGGEVPNEVHVISYAEDTGKLSTVAALNTGKELVVSITYCRVAKLWLASARTGCKILSFDAQANTLTELCSWETEQGGKLPEQNFARFSPDAKFIVTGGTDGLVKLWKVAGQNGKAPPHLHRTCGAQTKEILDADFSHDSKHMAACDGAGGCRLWEIEKEDGPENGIEINYASRHVKKGKTFSKLIRFTRSDNGSSVLIVGASGARGPAVVGIFALSGQLLLEILADKQPVKSIAVDGDGMRLLIGFMSGAKAVYSSRNLSLIKKTKELHSLPSQGVAFVGDTAVSASGDRDLHLLTVRGGGGSSIARFLCLLLLLVVMGLLVLRIADKGAALGQGQTEL